MVTTVRKNDTIIEESKESLIFQSTIQACLFFVTELLRASFRDRIMKAFHCIVFQGLSCASSMPLNECMHLCLVPKRILGQLTL